MYRDRSLIPAEAIRLLALGLLSEQACTYAELAAATRHFVSHMTGPSLDMMGPSIELLRHEGLIGQSDAPADGPSDPKSDDVPLTLTDAGRAAIPALLQARVRQPLDDVGKLVIALKMRFLDLLPTDRRLRQIEQLMDLMKAEQNRLATLLEETIGNRRARVDTMFDRWLRHEITVLDERLEWLEAEAARLTAS